MKNKFPAVGEHPHLCPGVNTGAGENTSPKVASRIAPPAGASPRSAPSARARSQALPRRSCQIPRAAPHRAAAHSTEGQLRTGAVVSNLSDHAPLQQSTEHAPTTRLRLALNYTQVPLLIPGQKIIFPLFSCKGVTLTFILELIRTEKRDFF